MNVGAYLLSLPTDYLACLDLPCPPGRDCLLTGCVVVVGVSGGIQKEIRKLPLYGTVNCNQG